MTNIVLISIAVLCLLISIRLSVSLWRKPNVSRWKKFLWTLVILVPLLGWLTYGGLFEPPTSNTTRANGSSGGWTPHRKDF